MAENIVNFTQNLQVKPSIFELVAADSLNSTIYPAVKRIVNFIVIKNPKRLGCFLLYYDELFLLFNGLVQNYYLKFHNGSLSEVFYGLSRQSNKFQGFSKKQHYLSFIIIVLIPYLSSKIETYVSTRTDNSKNKTQLKLFIKIKALITSLIDFLKLLQYITYISNKSVSHSPMMHLTGQHLKYISHEQYHISWSDILYGKVNISTILSEFLLRGLELSAFFLQFLYWWKNESTQKNIADLPIPAPPNVHPNGEKYLYVCPICLQKWDIPTAVSTSGYIYCFKCITKHLENIPKCPVTSYATSTEDLIRLYDD